MYIVGLLQIISGGLLGYAILSIKKVLSQDGNKTQINIAILAVHSATFGLYMVSVVFYYLFYSLYYLIDNPETVI